MPYLVWVTILVIALSAVLARPLGAEEFEPGDSVWIRFGDPDQQHGLYRLDWGESPLVIRGERYGRVTRKDTLHFRVDPRFLHEPMPVRIVVDYWDESTDWFMLRYGSSDVSGDRRGETKRTYCHYRTDTGTWKQVVFHLPDARFSGNAWNEDFRVCQDYWTGGKRHELIISRVEVIKGGVALTVTPETVPADGETTTAIEARVYDRSGHPAANGTRVEFTCTRGRIEPHRVATTAGRAIASFTGATEPGWADVTASALEDSTTVVVPMLEGKGPIHEVTYVMDDFSQPELWRTRKTDACEGTLSRDDAVTYRGRPVARWDYRYKRSAHLVIPMSRRIATPGRLKRLSLWIDHDGSGNGMEMYFRDANGTVLHWVLVKLWERGWRWEWRDLGQSWDRFEDADLRITWPLTFDWIAFSHWENTPGVGEMGVVYFQDLIATCLVPESALVWPDVEVETSLVEEPGGVVPCKIRVHNLSDKPHTNLQLDMTVVDRAGTTATPNVATFALAPGEIKTFEYSLRPTRYGEHTLEARVHGGDIESVGRDRLVVGMAEPSQDDRTPEPAGENHGMAR